MMTDTEIMDHAVVDLRNELGSHLGQVARLSNYLLDSQFSRAGFNITREQWSLLRLLWAEDGQSQQKLADRLMKNRASITSLIDNLEKQNLVVRVPNQKDKRSKLIYLTQQGRELKEPLADVFEATSQYCFRSISEENLETCMEVLLQVVRNIKSNNS
ncbi:MarR family transcriptional regulator [Persicobacter psychrovividus]|uniref:MarR family transcriptional regulator n=1 Tax=Persicobacter psychrovividus TaxID=387638 RepID=A0ABN6LEI3_9BACT|nr:MarR family transcriptional regulator [Persicobacter psychrovividus]